MRSDQELAEFSEHVLYEMAMLVAIPERFLAGDHDVVSKNALLEAFGIHARQLVRFFYDSEGSGEIVANSYFDDSKMEWKTVRQKFGRDLENLVKRVGEEIAHLTLTRNQSKGVDWPLFRIADAIINRFDLFLEGVSPTRINSNDKSRYLQLLQQYKDYVKIWTRQSLPAGGVDQGINTRSSPTLTAKTCPPDNTKTTRF